MQFNMSKTRARIGTKTGPDSLDATVYDLNGNPVRTGRPKPVLRRTASGHLFQPCNQVIKGSEMMSPVPLTPVAAQPQSTENVVTVQEPLTKQLRARSYRPPTSTSLDPTRQYTQRTGPRDLHDCRGESHDHRCWTSELGEFGRPDSETLPMTLFSNNGEKDRRAMDSDEDVWMQIAREMEDNER
jgi:hypothetical protein